MSVHISDQHTFATDATTLWQAVFDPAMLAELIPGCRELAQTSPADYVGEIILGVAAVAGQYSVTVHVDEADEPVHARLSGEITGPTGIIGGTAIFTIQEVHDCQTIFAFVGQATITGALGRMSPRFIEGIAMTLIKQGLARLDKRLAAQQTQTL